MNGDNEHDHPEGNTEHDHPEGNNEHDPPQVEGFDEISVRQFGSNHEPPIGVGGCSFFFDVPSDFFTLSTPVAAGIYQKYDFITRTDVVYTAISEVAIMTESRLPADGVSFAEFELASTQQVKLRIWLGTTREEPIDPDPDIIIDGVDGGSILSKIPLSPVSVSKNVRPTRHRHPDGQISAVKWELVDQNGTVLRRPNGTPCSASRDDLYYFYVSFFHE